MLNLTTPPSSLCILRLSAIGDTCHIVPIVRTLQRVWPTTRLTWVIGRVEARLMSVLPDVEFITIDKHAGARSARALRAQLHSRRFDVLLHMQLSLRASLLSALIPARVRLGFDRARARELQWLFTNAQIAPRRNEHVLDSFQGFLAALGIEPGRLEWDLPLPSEARQYAAGLIPDRRPTLLISPCSSHPLRNWRPERYAAIARHAAQEHGMRVILCGGRSTDELAMAAAIESAAGAALINQVGRDTLPQLLALLARATALLSPDSGPAHMATMVGTPVIGLYAATRPQRCGPYLSQQWCVDRYPQAARRYCGRDAADLPWQAKIERPGVMDLIGVDEVCERLDALLQASAGRARLLP
ncbi:MAG TPA: glycosyltransferase family 9 protein [Steroidobacteraceae bacterium]|jgi:heptosyltransferase I|nr:glycosyltransferase family 9 protein [Steroidobacteraceae bacterium]